MQTFLRVCSVILVSSVLLTAQRAEAQEATVLTLQPESRLWVEGTSNKNDWTVEAGEVEGTVSVRGNTVVSADVSVPAEKVVSDKSTIMDRLMHSALKVSDHPTISFALDQTATGTAADDGFTADASGRLTLAGETRDVQLSVTATRLDGGVMRFTGSYPLTMSDYGIKPPTAMFGALRTADDVVVHFDVVAAPATDTASK